MKTHHTYDVLASRLPTEHPTSHAKAMNSVAQAMAVLDWEDPRPDDRIEYWKDGFRWGLWTRKEGTRTGWWVRRRLDCQGDEIRKA